MVPLSLGFILGLACFITWDAIVVWQRHNPSFVLQGATVYSVNVSRFSPTLVVTISSFYGNRYGRIYYESVAVYAAYKGQRITSLTPVVSPGNHLGSKGSGFWSAVVRGDNNGDPGIPPSNVLTESGGVPISVKAVGIVIFEGGLPGFAGSLPLHVTCPVLIPVVVVNSTRSGAMTKRLPSLCSVSTE
ncbi:hypothetical protein DM860_005732 [Cuscuta australis]|uniref:Late embryogenesis abundant protein LEA-2 subgroup domain-containing protein n=1 Tax=Cuscuta australis TaxID=267555 RepID=A0A328DUT3_9ASTE|nr:hypothetical protein DM860_005732 [Cuscuta australis]